MSIIVRDLIQMAETQLETYGKENAKVDAELIFRHCFSVDKAGFFKLWGTRFDESEIEQYLQVVEIRAGGVPLQHITGEQEFMGLTFLVSPKVLIPRQETEVLVNQVIEIIEERKKHCDVLDLGCGSGAIGVSLAKLCKNVTIKASDISADAIGVAKRNARNIGVEKKITFVQGDLFEPFDKFLRKEKFDIIVSNPPYIKSSVIPELQVEVRDHEPLLALDGGEDGLSYYRKIIEKAPSHLKKGGTLALEIGHDQAGDIMEIVKEHGKFINGKFLRDLAGKDRVMLLYL